jgi:Protein kinase domain
MSTQALPTTADLPDRYEFLRELGAGLSGRAFLALDRQSGARVVVKRYHLGGPNDAPPAVLRAHYEKLLGLPAHPALCGVRAFETDEQGPYAVLEYVTGRPLTKLRARIERHARRSKSERTSAARDRRRLDLLLTAIEGVLDGLRTLHETGIAHGDCRSGNLIWARGRIVLIDYDRLLNREGLDEQDFRRACADDLCELGEGLVELARSISPLTTLDRDPRGIPLAYGRSGRVECRVAALACVLHELAHADDAAQHPPDYAVAAQARSGDPVRLRALRRTVARALLARLPPRPGWIHPLPLLAATASAAALASLLRDSTPVARLLLSAAALALILWCARGSQRSRARRGTLLQGALQRHRDLRRASAP